MPTILAQNGRRLVLNPPAVIPLQRDVWYFDATLEIDCGAVTTSVCESGDGIVRYFADLAESWKGWTGVKGYASLEGELTLDAVHDGLGTVTLTVRLARLLSDGWSFEAELDLGAGADMETQAQLMRAWSTGS